MNNDKIICIREDTDERLIQLQSEGYKIIQISASGIYCWILLRKTNNNKRELIKGFYNETDKSNTTLDEPTCQ